PATDDCSLLLLRDRLEIIVHLPPILGRCGVVGTRGKPILRTLGLQLLGQRRLDGFERLRGLPPQLLPFREILLERLGAWRRDRLARGFLERRAEAGAARDRRIVPAHALDEILRLLKLAHVFLAQLRRVGRSASPATLPSLARLPGVAGAS